MATQKTKIQLLVESEVRRALQDLDRTEKGINDISRAGKAATQTFASFNKILAGVGIGIGLREFLNLTQESIRLANIQEAAEKKVAQGVRSTGMAAGFTAKQLKAMASELQSITTFGDEKILNEVTAQLLTFTNIAGKQFAEAQKAVLNLATVLDGDLKSASIQLGKALNDPIANLSALSRSGIQFTVEQKELIKALFQAGDAAAAQTIILEELNRQYGGQAEALAKTRAGEMVQFENKLGDLKERFGELLKEGLNPFIAGLDGSIDTIDDFLDLLGVGGTERLRALSEEFVNFRERVQTQEQDIGRLISRYNDLKGQQTISREEQAELNKVIKALADIVPGAVSQVNDYGEALDINIKSVEAFVRAQKELLKRTERGIFEDIKGEIRDTIEETNRAQESIARFNAEIDRLADQDENTKVFLGLGDVIGGHLQESATTAGARMEFLRNEIAKLSGTIQTNSSDLNNLVLSLSLFENISPEGIQRLSAELKISEEEATRLVERFQELTRVSEEAAVAGQQAAAATRQQISQIIAEMLEVREGASAQIKELSGEEAEALISDLRNFEDEFTRVFIVFGDIFEATVADALNGWDNFFDNLKKRILQFLVSDAVKQLLNFIGQQYVIGFGNVFGAVLGGVTGSGLIGGIATALFPGSFGAAKSSPKLNAPGAGGGNLSLSPVGIPSVNPPSLSAALGGSSNLSSGGASNNTLPIIAKVQVESLFPDQNRVHDVIVRIGREIIKPEFDRIDQFGRTKDSEFD